MLMFAFFAAVFSSACWLIYAIMFVNAKLGAEGLWEQTPENMLLYLSVVFLPTLIIWMVFGYINQFISNRGMNKKQSELLKQLQKNQDYTDLVVRVMLDAEHEIKDGFVINKFDMFIADMNESLGEIIQRCNIASSAQLEQLWLRVKRGEKWTLGKAVLDASKNQSTFDAWVREKVNRDKVFRGSLLEFCSRYQNLLQLLEKHDRDRIFLRIIETGVFGKVYSIIAPLSEGLGDLSAAANDRIQPSAPQNDYASVLKLATMEEPTASESIINVDKNDEETEEEEIPPLKTSFFSRLNPFKKAEEPTVDEHEQDPFFKALHNSFKDNSSFEPEEQPQPVISTPLYEQTKNEPTLSSSPTTFGSLRNTLNNLRQNKPSAFESPENSADAEPHLHEHLSTGTDNAYAGEGRTEPSLNSADSSVSSNEAKEDENFVYPFGGWTDEENYRK